MAGKYRAYAEYCETNTDWLGDAPKHWKTIPVGRLFQRVKRTSNPDKELLSVYRDYGVVPTASRDDNNNKPSEDLDPYQLVMPNDLVMNKMKAWQGSIAMSEYEGIVSPAYFVYQPRAKLFDVAYPKYVHYLLRNPIYIAQYLRQSKGIRVSQWDLDPEEFQKIELLLPEKDEQIKIFQFLDYETAKIDTLIEKQQQLIKLLQEKRQAVISHAVTKGLNPNVPMRDSGVEWLGEVPEHWEIKRLKNTSKIVDCRNKTPIYFEGGEYFVVRTTNVKSQQLNLNEALFTDEANFKIWTQRGIPPAGSILFTREAPAGEVCLVPENLKFCLGQRMMNFICHSPEYTDYLFDFLLSDCLERYIASVSHGSTVSHLRVEQVENIPVLVPPLSEAREIHKSLKAIKAKYSVLTEEAEKAITLMQERRTALISAAVTGKIDVRDWRAPQSAPVEQAAEVA